MQQNTVSKKVSYAINTYADFNLKVLESTFSGMLLNINNLIYRFEPNDKELRVFASIISSLSKKKKLNAN